MSNGWCPDLQALRVPTLVGFFLAKPKARLKSVL
jgi:hypothetical protein